MPAKIAQLRPQVAAAVHSASILQDLSQAVEECASNSLDAAAKDITVHINPASGTAQIDDDGLGIPADSFGNLAVSNCTSKLHTASQLQAGLSTLGFRGQALASIAQVAVLEVCSRAQGSFQTSTKLVRGGKVLKVGIAAQQRQKQGTSITIRDFLFNQPVRRRQQAAKGWKKELEACRDRLFRLALIHPAVSFTLVDTTNHMTLLKLQQGRTWETVLPLLFGECADSLQSVDQHGPACQLTGYVSSPPHGCSSKDSQYLYVNGRYVTHDRLSKLVNNLHQQVTRQLEVRSASSYQQDAITRATRTVRRFPAFILQLRCPLSAYDITYEADKTFIEFANWEPILETAQRGVLQAWRAVAPEGMLSAAGRTVPLSDSAPQQRQGQQQGQQHTEHGTVDGQPSKRSSGQRSSFATWLQEQQADVPIEPEPPGGTQVAGQLTVHQEPGNENRDSAGPAFTAPAGRTAAGETHTPLARHSTQQTALSFSKLCSYLRDGKAPARSPALAGYGSRLPFYQRKRTYADAFSDHPQRNSCPAVLVEHAMTQSRHAQRAEHAAPRHSAGARMTLSSAGEAHPAKCLRPDPGKAVCSSHRVQHWAANIAQDQPGDIEHPHFHSQKADAADEALIAPDMDLDLDLDAILDVEGELDRDGQAQPREPQRPAGSGQQLAADISPEAAGHGAEPADNSRRMQDGRSSSPLAANLLRQGHGQQKGSSRELGKSPHQASLPEWLSDAPSLPADILPARAAQPASQRTCAEQHIQPTWERPASWLEDLADASSSPGNMLPFSGARPVGQRPCADQCMQPTGERPASWLEDLAAASPIPLRFGRSACAASAADGQVQAQTGFRERSAQQSGGADPRCASSRQDSGTFAGTEPLWRGRRAQSAPPHRARHHRAVHTNPHASLESSQHRKQHTQRLQAEAPCSPREPTAAAANRRVLADRSANTVSGMGSLTGKSALLPCRPSTSEQLATMPGRTNPLSACSRPGNGRSSGLSARGGRADNSTAAAADALTACQQRHAQPGGTDARQSSGANGVIAAPAGRSLAAAHVEAQAVPVTVSTAVHAALTATPSSVAQQQRPLVAPIVSTATQQAPARDHAPADTCNASAGVDRCGTDRQPRKPAAYAVLPGQLNTLLTERRAAQPQQQPPQQAHMLPGTNGGARHQPEAMEADAGRSPRPHTNASAATLLAGSTKPNLSVGVPTAVGSRAAPNDPGAAFACSPAQASLSTLFDGRSAAEPRKSVLANSEGIPSSLPPFSSSAATGHDNAMGVSEAPGSGSRTLKTMDMLLQQWDNPCIRPPEKAVLDLSALSAGALHMVVPQAITRRQFQQARVLRQIDSKFVAMVCDGVVVLVDQHAADERVLLEALREQVLGKDRGDISCTSACLKRPIALALTASELQQLQQHSAKVQAWGWRTSWHADQERLLLTHAPSLFGTMLTATDLQIYLQQLADTHGASVLPAGVTRVLNSKACRSAIMFGDKLLPSECERLVTLLQATQLCFSCAHGRPTMVPLVKLDALHRLRQRRAAELCAVAPLKGQKRPSLLAKLRRLTKSVLGV